MTTPKFETNQVVFYVPEDYPPVEVRIIDYSETTCAVRRLEYGAEVFHVNTNRLYSSKDVYSAEFARKALPGLRNDLEALDLQRKALLSRIAEHEAALKKTPPANPLLYAVHSKLNDYKIGHVYTPEYNLISIYLPDCTLQSLNMYYSGGASLILNLGFLTVSFTHLIIQEKTLLFYENKTPVAVYELERGKYNASEFLKREN